MFDRIVDVQANGSVSLGGAAVCDGFADGYKYRVQTHVHDDHMNGFNRSKGRQIILMSPETRELLIAEQNADLPIRNNLIGVTRGDNLILDNGSEINLVPSNHMLGSCQVSVVLPDGYRVGYSSDFGWPLDEVIQVDELVVDSTYGNPNSIRGYTQDHAEECLHTTVSTRLRQGPVHLQAYRGTIERVINVIADMGVPILASEKLIRYIKVLQKHGLAIADVIELGSDDYKHAVSQRSYIRLYSKGDGHANDGIDGSKIVCSAFMTDKDNPLKQFTDKSFRVAMSNHADFEETLKYIELTGAKKIVTDNTRTHGYDLAHAINLILPNVMAMPSSNNSE